MAARILHFSRQATPPHAKTGQGRLTLDALWRLPSDFWVCFEVRINATKQLTQESQREMKAARIGELVRLILEVSA